MPLTNNSYRYFNLLTNNTITSGELNTELADAGNLSALDFVMNYNYWNRVFLAGGSDSLDILQGSEIAKYRYIITNGYLFSLLASYLIQALNFSTETISSKTSHTEIVYGVVTDTSGGALWSNTLTSFTTNKLYKYSYNTNLFTLHGSALSNKHLGNGAYTATTEGFGGFVAGQTASSVYTRNLSKFNYSSQTSSSVANITSGNRNYFQCTESSTDAYTMSGSITNAPTTNTTVVDKISKSTDSTAVNSNSLSVAKSRSIAFSSSLVGYNVSGVNTASTALSSVDKIVFSTDTVSIMSAAITQAQSYGTGVGGKNYGYSTGGFTGSWTTTVDRIKFSDETVSVSGTATASVDAAAQVNGAVGGG